MTYAELVAAVHKHLAQQERVSGADLRAAQSIINSYLIPMSYPVTPQKSVAQWLAEHPTDGTEDRVR